MPHPSRNDHTGNQTSTHPASQRGDFSKSTPSTGAGARADDTVSLASSQRTARSDFSTATTVVEGGEQSEEVLVRPDTPPKGTRYYPWRSYRDLPAEHPVFHYPAHVREKLYGEGIDPIDKAEMDKDLRSSVYGERGNAIMGWRRRANGMMAEWGTAHIGALN